MANKSSESRCGGVAMKSTSKNLEIRLLGHCIICLRKASLNRKDSPCGTSEYFRDDNERFDSTPEIAPKSIITTPGFLTTFNQVWAVLQLKLKERNRNCSSEEIGISLEKVLLESSPVSKVLFSKAPTMCEVCCDKIVAVENLMKAVRQQVRELSMLLEKGRSTQDGGLGEFEKSLLEKGLEENEIRGTLQFLGIFEHRSPDDFKDLKGDHGSAEAGSTGLNLEFEEYNSISNSQIDCDANNEEAQSAEPLNEDFDEEDPDYIKSEPDEDDDVNESEEEMDVDDEDKNDPDDFQEVEQDPLAITPKKRRKYNLSSGNWANKVTSSEDKKANPDNYKFTCSCGKIFATSRTLRGHMSRNKNAHPEYQPFKDTLIDSRQICELCGEWVMFTDILDHLTGVHLNGQDEWVIKCPYEKCQYMFASTKAFHFHLSQSKNKECNRIWMERCGYFCDICGFKGTSLLKIKYHVKEKHENGKEKKVKCPISHCGKMFCVKQSVHHHLHEHQYRPPITEQICDKCQGKFKIEEMEGHLKDKHGVNEVIGCKQCPLKFSGRDELVEHLYEHRGLGIICDICGEDKFNRYVDFREHYFVVHKLCPKKYKCGEGDCEYSFWTKETLEKHEWNVHRDGRIKSKKWIDRERGKGRKDFGCDKCDVKFATEIYLTSHKIKVHGADPFCCDICGETFVEKKKFNRHKREHAGIVFQKEWNCEVEGCGKTFKAKTLWKRHQEVSHGGERKHVCEICGKSYCDAGGLKTHHDSVHLGLRPYVCEDCGEGFRSSTVLKRHKLIHTGERPFGCEICGQRFRV